ncbi:MAG: hypothetical protein LBB55_01310 [Zoogloeaceae bacterium]|jgi:hypothetical protein|nr:hypothetical protein [Zoogloeaceae bacterium]
MASLLRLLLIFVLGWIVWRLLRPDASRSARTSAEKPDAGNGDDERIAACAWCHVYVPEKEMTQAQDGRRYCCAEHLRAAEAEAKKERK